MKILQVAENFASWCALQVSEADLEKPEGLADKALRLILSLNYLRDSVPEGILEVLA
jgi:hypothetical protein